MAGRAAVFSPAPGGNWPPPTPWGQVFSIFLGQNGPCALLAGLPAAPHEVHIEFSSENSVILAGAVMKIASLLGLQAYELALSAGPKAEAVFAGGCFVRGPICFEAAHTNSDIKKFIALSSIFHAARAAQGKNRTEF